ncbi:MAG: bacteriohemerythrin [Candidatus Marinimicrobia bacterium]|nr:bacteriohemerythrin [Candidatus Neomarinimicrobiota bacterium]
MPSNFYLEFVKRNGLYKEIQELHQKRLFLQKTQIFGEAISYPIQNKIAKIMQLYSYRADQEVAKDDLNRLLVIRNGKVVRYIDEDIFETLSSYDFFMEDQILTETPSLFQYRTVESTDVYKIPGDELLDIPIVLWKLLESYRKRMRILFDPTTSIKPMFSWRNEYSVNIKEIDNQHKKLFNMANNLYEAIDSAKEKSVLRNALDFLISYTKFHFGAEEKLMEQYKYPGYKTQVKEHHYFVKEVIKLRNQFDKGKIEINIDVIEFFKDWIIDHILTEDRKYSDFLNKKGVS